MADLADHAFAHACAVLGVGDAAVASAVTAVRRGGRSRWAVLGHARSEALERAGEATAPALDAAVPEDLTDLAAALAATRPALERVIVDLDGRHGLDRGGFARALGLPVAPASARAAAVYVEWQHHLDPVVLARLGPGGCEGLAAVLGTPPPEDAAVDDGDGDGDDGADAIAPADRPSGGAATPTLRDLVHLGPVVADHAGGCEACSDRLRAMVSVRTLLGQRPLERAPAEVRAAAAPSRLRRPALPPSLEPEPPTRRWLRTGAIVAAAFVVAVGGGAAVAARDAADDGRASTQIEALTRLPAGGSALDVDRSSVEGTTPPPVTLSNVADRAVEWTATPDVAWLQVTPSTGTLGPGQRATLRLGVTPDAPEGAVHGAVRISGIEGSTAVVRLSTTVERPPEVGATAQACAIAATVEDEGEVRAVELHWREQTVERLVPLRADDAGGYAGALPPSESPMTWWVTASDARGNTGRTPDQHLTAGACP
jgi:hypothetical protein